MRDKENFPWGDQFDNIAYLGISAQIILRAAPSFVDLNSQTAPNSRAKLLH